MMAALLTDPYILAFVVVPGVVGVLLWLSRAFVLPALDARWKQTAGDGDEIKELHEDMDRVEERQTNDEKRYDGELDDLRDQVREAHRP